MFVVELWGRARVERINVRLLRSDQGGGGEVFERLMVHSSEKF